MLPNPKNKNINNLLPNIENQGPSEAEISQKRLKNKRFAILFSLFITAGLSFIFWGYKEFQILLKSPPKIHLNLKLNLPKINFNKNLKTTKSSTVEIQKFLQTSSPNWSIFTSLDSNFSQPVFEYQSDSIKSSTNFSQIIDHLSTIKPSFQSLVNLNLPQGLVFQEVLNHTDNFSYQGLITLPKNKILIIIQTESSQDFNKISQDLPTLINLIYWYSVGQLN